jgi:hypothetical protein
MPIPDNERKLLNNNEMKWLSIGHKNTSCDWYDEFLKSIQRYGSAHMIDFWRKDFPEIYKVMKKLGKI